MIISTLNDKIEEKARQESISHSPEYAPSSYKSGFIDGAKWMAKQCNVQ